MRRFGLAALLLLAGGWDALRTADPDVDRGNLAFREGRYDEALGHYRSAGERGADPRLHFDMGTALYKLGEKSADEGEKAKLYQQAEEEFRRAADTEDAGLKSSAYFNLGNTMYQRRQWEDAIAAYKRALRADAGNDSARNNLEMALRQREKQEQQQKGQKGQKGTDQDQDGPDGQEPDPQRDQQGRADQQDPQKQQGQDPQQGQPPDRKQQGQNGQQDGQEPDQPRGEPDQQGQPGAEDEERQKREEQARRQAQQGQESQGGSESESAPSDQDRKLDELERRSRDLRKRLLRQSGKNRDPLRLPSRRDW
jgi:Ca-activated chloride channel family protein